MEPRCVLIYHRHRDQTEVTKEKKTIKPPVLLRTELLVHFVQETTLVNEPGRYNNPVKFRSQENTRNNVQNQKNNYEVT